MTSPEIHVKFQKEMIRIAKLVKKSPEEISKAIFQRETTLTDWQVRKAGNFQTLKNLYFPKEDLNLGVKYGSRLVNSHRNKISKQTGEALFWKKEIIETLEGALDKEWKLYPPPRKKKPKKSSIKRTLTVKVSDTHFGANISSREVNGANAFNWELASRRMAFLADQVVSYKPQYRNQTELVIQLNGDIMAGVIHNQEWFVDLLTVQFVGSLRILSQFISYLAYHFPQVRVTCSPGNHGRAMHKSSKDRAMTHKWDSYENMLYAALREILTSVNFTIPEAPYVIYDVYTHKMLQTHGDTVINVGNPGAAINMRSINEQVNRINASLPAPVDAVCVGHVHVPTVQRLECGATILINGCLSGLDPFANAIGNWSMAPTQILFESTPSHAVGDIRMITVADGDSLKKMDSIIDPVIREDLLDE